jgi:hypothetical protein
MDRACAFGPNRNLIGILGEPSVAAAAADRPAVVLLNAGLLHRVGPFGLYVEICRRLTEAGFFTFRFDPTGLGDSAASADSRPIDEREQQDVVIAMDYLAATKGCREFVLAGLCSGADNAYHVALRDRRVVGMIWLDGFANRSLGYYLRHYLPRFVSGRTWMRLMRRTAKRIRSSMGQAIEPMALREFPEKEMLKRGLRTLADAGVRMLLIYTGGVRKYYNHPDQLQRTLGRLGVEGQVIEEFYPDFDHVYTLMEDREKIIDRIGQWVTTQFGAARAADPARLGDAQADRVADPRGLAGGRIDLVGR